MKQELNTEVQELMREIGRQEEEKTSTNTAQERSGKKKTYRNEGETGRNTRGKRHC